MSYAVLIFGALSYFYAPFGEEGNTWQAIVGASIALWLVHALVLMGVRQAAIVNTITTIAKLAPIFLFIVLALVAFNLPTFQLDFWGTETLSLGSITAQVQSTMLVTLWVFIGIEGASVGSGRATEAQRYRQGHDPWVCDACFSSICWCRFCRWALCHSPNWRAFLPQPLWPMCWSRLSVLGGLWLCGSGLSSRSRGRF